MILKNELRIGNNLKYLLEEYGIDWVVTKIDIQDLEWCESRNENFNELHKGIELTTEILTNSGFTKNNNGSFEIDLQTHYLELIQMGDGFYPYYAQLQELYCDIEQRVSLRRIQFVHELENLFYVLTGEEINIIF